MMISLMQVTGLIGRVIAFVRGLISQILDIFRGLFFPGGNETVTIPEPEVIEPLIEPEPTAVITPFGIVLSVVVVALAIFATIQYKQYKFEKEQEEEALQGNISIVEARGNVQKISENESEKEGDGDEREEER